MRDKINNSDKWVMRMKTFLNKICLGPLFHNCLILKTGNANPGFSNGCCIQANCLLGFPRYLLDETFKLVCEEKVNKKKFLKLRGFWSGQHKSLNAGGVCL